MNTKQLRRGEQLKYLQRKLAAAEQAKREIFGMRDVDHALDREIKKLKRKIKQCKK